jgi:monoamine oxidase
MARPKQRRVIVIGAGMAGLTTLDHLSHAGYEVTVLEANSRPGGRIRTLREPFADGLYADAGATYVVDCHARVLDYVDELDLPLQILNPRHLPALLHLRGRNFPMKAGLPRNLPLALTANERKLGFEGMLDAYLSPGLKAAAEPSITDWPDVDGAALDRMNGRELLHQAGASPAAIELLGVSLFGLYGNGIDSLSALFLVTQQKLADFTVTYTIPGGMDMLPNALAARFHDRIQYGCEVTRIHHDARGVTVTVRRGGATSTLAADFAVVAIPYAALRHMRITPALPSGKRRVVTRLLNTSVVRAFVQCSKRFWEGIDGSGTVFTDIPGLSIFSGYTRPSHRGILEAYISGTEARRLSALPEPKRNAAVLEMMTRVFDTLPQFAETVVTHCWDTDPWSRGAYAWYAPRQLVSFLPHLARPEGRLHFAGDHTSLVPGWVEGAIESGDRVATEIEARR